MDRQTIVATLREFLESEFPNQGLSLSETTDLLNEWFVDSLGIIETVLFIEKAFGLEVSRADINGTNFKSIATLSDYISARLAR